MSAFTAFVCPAPIRRCSRAAGFVAGLLALAPAAQASPTVPALVDDFSVPHQTATGAARALIDDATIGSKSQATQRCEKGLLLVEGQLTPGRGTPAFITIPLLLQEANEPQDLTGYTGVRLRVRITQGNLSVQVGSAAIDNFDYHTSAPLARQDGNFQELRIPFTALRRTWSEQVPLDLATVTSVNLVSAGMAPGPFSYVVDEIGFY